MYTDSLGANAIHAVLTSCSEKNAAMTSVFHFRQTFCGHKQVFRNSWGLLTRTPIKTTEKGRVIVHKVDLSKSVSLHPTLVRERSYVLGNVTWTDKLSMKLNLLGSNTPLIAQW